MVELPVSRREVRRVYGELIDEVSVRKRRLGAELPVETTADIPDQLRGLVHNWESGRKSLRTVPACNVYARHLDEPVPESVTRTLTGLDGTINVLDDIIDTRELPTESKIALTVNAAFSGVLMVDGCPADAREAVGDLLLEYFTTVFQIPLVERDLLARMQAATSTRARRDAAAALYSYRARDIDAFARLPAAVLDVDPETERHIAGDLRNYRARRLLFKDIGDVERDLADGDATPLIELLRCRDSTAGVVEEIEALHGRFAYSEAGRDTYRDLLADLEDAPVDLSGAVRHSRDVMAEAVV